MNVDEKELMQELKNIKDIKMDVVPPNILYGGAFKIIGVGFLYFLMISLLPPIFLSLKLEMSVTLLRGISFIVIFSIIYFLISFIIFFSIAFQYTLFKEGIAPHLKYGEVLRERFIKGVKITLFVHFSILIITTFILSYFSPDSTWFIFVG